MTKAFFLSLITVLITNLGVAQTVNYNAANLSDPSKLVYFCGADSLLDDKQKEILFDAFSSRIIFRSESYQFEKIVSDTSFVFFSLEPNLDTTAWQLVGFKGGKKTARLINEEPYYNDIPEDVKLTFALQLDSAKTRTRMLETYLISGRRLLNVAARMDSYDDYWARYEDKEWFATGFQAVIDSADASPRTQRAGFEGERRQRMGIMTEKLAIAARKNPKAQIMYLDRQVIKDGQGNETVAFYLYDLVRGLVFFVEEPKQKKGKNFVSDEYLDFLLQENQLILGKHPKVANRGIFEAIRQ
ncbi:hypothetical protein [Sanyastnella coralliicola]|uniref:hypothetical protein n=1 Tax=Sanyastnella coralliicola TaxID=3069118 RepID=UPI0027B8DD9F|nr:hypothetical protein [Longitalea sp. SCSIO 12813]